MPEFQALCVAVYQTDQEEVPKPTAEVLDCQLQSMGLLMARGLPQSFCSASSYVSHSSTASMGRLLLPLAIHTNNLCTYSPHSVI